MTNLNEVLARKEEVLNLIDSFGFAREADIYGGVEPLQANKTITLMLTIKHKSLNVSIPPENASLLEAKLSDVLRCTVKINMTEGIASYQAKALAKRSTSIENKATLCTLFGVSSLEEVILDDSEKPDAILLRRANSYLEKTASPKVRSLSNAQAINSHGLLPDSSSGEESALKKAKPESSTSSSPDKTDLPLKGVGSLAKK